MKDVESARSQFYDEGRRTARRQRDASWACRSQDFDAVRPQPDWPEKDEHLRPSAILLRPARQELMDTRISARRLNEIKGLLAAKGLRLGSGGGKTEGQPPLAPVVLRRRPLSPEIVAPGILSKAAQRPGTVRPQPQGAAAAEHHSIGELRPARRTRLLGCKNSGTPAWNEINAALATFGLG